MFKTIGSLCGRLLGTDTAVNKLIDHASNGLDKMIYTSEEKAEDIQKDRSEARKMVIEWMKATSGQNLARRLIALVVTGIWSIQYVASGILMAVAPWCDKTDTVKACKECADAIGEHAVSANGAMMLVLAFYFAAPHMGSIVQGALSKFGGKKN